MIPILYAPETEQPTGSGIGRLSDAISVTVTEAINGEYEMVMTYPKDGVFYDQIQVGSVIAVKPSKRRSKQAFIVYDISRPISGIVTIYCEHVSYRMSFIPVAPFSAGSLAETLGLLPTKAAEPCPFSFWTDKTVDRPYTQELPASMRARLQGEQGSILQTYKGQYEFDNLLVRLWTRRGQDNGVTIRYGKNLMSLEQEENIRDTITGVYPFWKGMEGEADAYVELPEKVLRATSAQNFPFPRTVPLDLSSEWSEEKPTVEQLRARAERYMTENDIGIPEISLKVSFVDLSQTEDYKDAAVLEEVDLGDMVTVQFPSLGVNNRAQVTRTEYDVLLERYKTIDIGARKANLAKVIVDQGQATQAVKDNATHQLEAFNSALNQKAIFDRLTNGGEEQGIYEENGKIYINGSYIRAGIIDAEVVRIINLIAHTLESEIQRPSGYGGAMRIIGGELSTRGYDAAKENLIRTMRIFSGPYSSTSGDMGTIMLFLGDPGDASYRYVEINPVYANLGIDGTDKAKAYMRVGSVSVENGLLDIKTGQMGFVDGGGVARSGTLGVATVRDTGGTNRQVLILT